MMKIQARDVFSPRNVAETELSLDAAEHSAEAICLLFHRTF